MSSQPPDVPAQPPISRKFVLEFTKMSGAGNDFIVIDNRFYRFTPEELSRMAARFCPRRRGVGADGLLALGPADEGGVDYRMTYFNADGSLGTMCGNGARCLARFAWDAGIQGHPLEFSSDAGIYHAEILEDGSVRLFVPPPASYRPMNTLESDHPFAAKACHYIWTGTEHLVVFVDNTEQTDVETLGPRLRRDDALGAMGANVNFVEIQDIGGSGNSAKLRVRTFEKGVEAETLACGTGSIASSLTAALSGRSEASRFEVSMPGGVLVVGFEGPAESPEDLYLEGPADVVYRGNLEL